MSWITPKTDWIANDTIGSDDFNRIEGNIEYLYDGTSIDVGVKITTTYLTEEQTGNARFSRNGKSITVALPTLYGTSNSTTLAIHAQDIGGYPSEILPTESSHSACWVWDDSTYFSGFLTMPTIGNETDPITIIKSDNSNFRPSGSKGSLNSTTVYLL